MKTAIVLLITALLFMVGIGYAADPSIAGTYQLTKRTLADGKVLSPPAIHGMFTLTSSQRNFNVGWQDPSGKHFSYSVISNYKLTNKEYSETVLFSVSNDEIGLMPGSKPGTGPVYVVNGETKTVPVKIEGTKIGFQPPMDSPYLVYDGNKMTATIEGTLVDTWEKVEIIVSAGR